MSRYFNWSVDANEDWETLWDDFFLLYDIMHEPVSHLVEPVLPRFDLILRKPNPSTPHLHSTWWALLFYRGFQNDTVSVKRRILEYVLSIESPEALNVLGCEFEFIFSALLTTLDNTALYSVPTLGTMVSPFGEMVRTFCGRLIKAYEKDEDRYYTFSNAILLSSETISTPAHSSCILRHWEFDPDIVHHGGARGGDSHACLGTRGFEISTRFGRKTS
ncbi:hypothetical protein BC938DRAFT_471926 [Jimgerdemannia flammicorona]|uniref:Proteasome activator Blm10 mid region domain-containing protein n=1 Tax=Jimgerdemannia flammicorona TaxID=994334 RepID=A0A433Q763_9FUNG|nr:hypothetical protein BC938DRAFT_471926 [Jimgerdemannia flammicorona]